MTKNLALTLASLSAVALLSACGPLTKDGLGPQSVEQAHPIKVAPEVANLTLDVPVGAKKMTPELEAQTRAFLAMYRVRGHDGFTVALPANGANSGNAKRIGDQVVKLAREEGVPSNEIFTTRYSVAPGTQGGVNLSFTRYTATASPCGDWSHNANESFQNDTMPDFGCSMQNNIAAMVEDPRDLLTARTMEAADAERRATVMKAYRTGAVAGSQLSNDQRAAISKVGE